MSIKKLLPESLAHLSQAFHLEFYCLSEYSPENTGGRFLNLKVPTVQQKLTGVANGTNP